jgi:hydroxypyruvate isomerase
MKQSFAWWCVKDKITDPLDFFRQTREIGYRGIELIPQELWPMAKQAGLEIVSESVGSLTNGLNRRQNHGEIRHQLVAKLELAVTYNIPNLIVFSGNRAGLDDEQGMENTVQGLRALAPLAEKSGVTLVLELLNSIIDHPDYQCDHTSWAHDVVKSVNSSHVKILYDIYHMQVMEGNLINNIQQISPWIGHVHTAGNPGRNDLDDSQEINYPGVMRTLKDIDYTGYIGQEFIPKQDALEALKHAYRVCNV